jgi:hypothetical protein
MKALAYICIIFFKGSNHLFWERWYFLNEFLICRDILHFKSALFVQFLKVLFEIQERLDVSTAIGEKGPRERHFRLTQVSSLY